MFVEYKKAGVKQFFIVLAVACIIGLIGSYISYLLPGKKIIGDILVIGTFCVLAYFVLIHYASIMEYRIDNYRVFLCRKIGARSKCLEFKISSICEVSNTCSESAQKKISNMCVSMLTKRHAVCISYRDGSESHAVWLEPSAEFMQKLNEVINGMENKTDD